MIHLRAHPIVLASTCTNAVMPMSCGIFSSGVACGVATGAHCNKGSSGPPPRPEQKARPDGPAAGAPCSQHLFTAPRCVLLSMSSVRVSFWFETDLAHARSARCPARPHRGHRLQRRRGPLEGGMPPQTAQRMNVSPRPRLRPPSPAARGGRARPRAFSAPRLHTPKPQAPAARPCLATDPSQVRPLSSRLTLAYRLSR